METPSEPQISADRLVQAAETALGAATKVWKQRGGPRPYPADLMGGPDQPACLQGYTRWEMERASEFLVRLGLIEKPGRERWSDLGNFPGIHDDASRGGPAPQ